MGQIKKKKRVVLIYESTKVCLYRELINIPSNHVCELHNLCLKL